MSSKIDSKIILDGSGAEQLIGRGDMLYSQGNEPVRIQCAFVDTPEIKHITDFIGAQRAYPDAYLLPEYVGPDSEPVDLDFDPSERDPMFREAAEVVVNAPTRFGFPLATQTEIRLQPRRSPHRPIRTRRCSRSV